MERKGIVGISYSDLEKTLKLDKNHHITNTCFDCYDNKRLRVINVEISGPDCYEVREGEMLLYMILKNGKIVKG